MTKIEMPDEVKDIIKEESDNSNKYPEIPLPYVIHKSELHQQKEEKAKGEVVGYSYQRISRDIPRIKHRLEDIENGNTYYSLEFEDIKRKSKRTIQVESEVISQTREILQLSKKGFSIKQTNAPDIINYLDLYESRNDIKIKKAVSRLGHIKGEFVHPALNTEYELITNVPEYQRLAEAFKPKGTLKEYSENVFPQLDNNRVALFYVYSSLASMLLEHHNVEPFIVDISDKTSTGKTALLRLAASVYGDYKKLSATWNTTKVNIERRASFLNSFPLLLDDTQKGMEKIIKDTIYHFSSGEEKGRGNTKAIDEIKRWNNILLSTGKTPYPHTLTIKAVQEPER